MAGLADVGPEKPVARAVAYSVAARSLAKGEHIEAVTENYGPDQLESAVETVGALQTATNAPDVAGEVEAEKTVVAALDDVAGPLALAARPALPERPRFAASTEPRGVLVIVVSAVSWPGSQSIETHLWLRKPKGRLNPKR